jgi:hypothetical protein
MIAGIFQHKDIVVHGYKLNVRENGKFDVVLEEQEFQRLLRLMRDKGYIKNWMTWVNYGDYCITLTTGKEIKIYPVATKYRHYLALFEFVEHEPNLKDYLEGVTWNV